MSNETVDVALCERLIQNLLNFGPEAGQSSLVVQQLRALMAERTQLHAVIAELVRVERALMAADGSWNISEDTFAWQRAFDVADGEAK